MQPMANLMPSAHVRRIR